MSAHSLADLFGLASLSEFERRAQPHVTGSVDARQLLNAFAVFGDAELSRLVVWHLWNAKASNRLSPGAVTKRRALYVCNQSLRGFLQLATSFDADTLEQTFRVGSDANDHSWGTVFEALLWLAVLEKRVDVAETVAKLIRWVDKNVEPALLQGCADDEPSLLLDGRTMQDMFKRALPPPPRVRAALEWSALPSMPAGRAQFSSHAFDLDEIGPRHCTIKGSYAEATWHGCFCSSCSAMLVVRQVSNRNSDYFIIGFKECPRARLSTWLDEYVDDFALYASEVTHAIPIAQVRAWILVDDPDGRRNVDCQTCGARYRFTKCSNRNPCQKGACSNKHHCGKESAECSAACGARRVPRL